MSTKNALLAAAAVAVLGMGVYLFIQVRSNPAQAGASETHVTRTPPVADRTPTPPPPEPAPPVPGSTRTKWEMARKETSPAGEGAPTVASDTTDHTVNLKLDNMMELANKAYDTQDFDQAIAIAGKVLSKEPNNIRMLRVMVSANCIQGDSAVAQANYEKLPKFDREQMKARCDRYGVVFKEPAQ